MKKIILSLCVALSMICGCTDGSETSTKTENLREVGVEAGVPVSNDFQAEYAQYVWADSPKIYIPTFGTAFDLTSKTYYDVNSVELNGLTNISVEFWFDPATTGTFNGSASVIFMACDVNGSTRGFSFHWHDSAQQFRLMSCGYNGGTLVFLASDLVAGSNHVVIETKSGGFKIFLNGVLIEELTVGYNSFTTVTEPFRIGANTVGGQNYIGGLDNFAVYDRVLTTDEIIQHYTVGSDLLNR